MKIKTWGISLFCFNLCFGSFIQVQAQDNYDPFDTQSVAPTFPNNLIETPETQIKIPPAEVNVSPTLEIPQPPPAVAPEPIAPIFSAEPAPSIAPETKPAIARDNSNFWDWFADLFEVDDQNQNVETPETVVTETQKASKPDLKLTKAPPSLPESRDISASFLETTSVPTLPVQIKNATGSSNSIGFIDGVVDLFQGSGQQPTLPKHTYTERFERIRPIETRLTKTLEAKSNAIELASIPQDVQIAKPTVQSSPSQINNTDSVLHSVVSKNKPNYDNAFKPNTQAPSNPVSLQETPNSDAQNSRIPKVTHMLENVVQPTLAENDTPRTMTIDVQRNATGASIASPEDIPQETGFFGRIANFFGSEDEADELASLSQNENEKPSIPKVSQDLPLTVVITKPNPQPLDPRFKEALLGMGNDIQLAQSSDQIKPKDKCFTKLRGTNTFCLTSTTWPEVISPYFELTTHLFVGTKAIVKYEENIATRLFALFETHGYETIVSHFTRELGEPTNVYTRKTRTIKMGRVDNPVSMWRRKNPNDGLFEVIEIRKIADMRGSIPDMKRGAIRVYFEGTREIFAMTSDLDYMQLR